MAMAGYWNASCQWLTPDLASAPMRPMQRSRPGRRSARYELRAASHATSPFTR